MNNFVGNTAYVLTYNPELPKDTVSRTYLLWNPNTGHHYRHDEPYTPLKSVDCIFNQHNVRFCLLYILDAPKLLFFEKFKLS